MINPTCPKGHKFYDTEFLRYVSSKKSVTYVCKSGYLDKNILNEFGIKIHEIPEKYYPEDPYLNMSILKKIEHWMKCFSVLRVIQKINFEDYEKIIFLDFNFITVPLLNFLKNKRKIYFVNHRMGTVNQKLKKILLNSLNVDFNFVFLAEYIRDYYKSIFPKYENLFVIHHPLPLLKDIENTNNGNIIFAPGASNSELFIDILYQNKEDLESYLNREGVQLIIKSKKISYESKDLIIYNNFLSDVDYHNYLTQSFCVVQFYDTSFDYITSGVFYEALGNSKPIIALDNLFIRSMVPVMKDNLVIFNDIESFIKAIEKIHKQEKKSLVENYNQIDEMIKFDIDKFLE